MNLYTVPYELLYFLVMSMCFENFKVTHLMENPLMLSKNSKIIDILSPKIYLKVMSSDRIKKCMLKQIFIRKAHTHRILFHYNDVWQLILRMQTNYLREILHILFLGYC